ncbi:MAG: prenyltransferase/squalene oxidase repeat-containing protein [Pirellulales bacterium]
MPLTYLENLTLRLAQGANRLDGRLRARQAGFFQQSQNEDGGFPGRQGGSDLYYTGFGLRGLALLGELDGEPAERAARFLKSRLGGHAPIVDFFSLLYGAGLLKTAAGIDIFAEVSGDYATAIANMFESFRRPDGGYAKTEEGQSSSTYYSFLVVLSCELIERPVTEPRRLVDFVRSRQREDGGFVEIGPMKRSGTNPTAAAIGTLKVLDAVDPPTREAVIDFLAESQSDEGGLLANTRIPIADILSTFTGTLTLLDLASLDAIDAGAARRYVASMELPTGGFVGGAWDQGTDVEYAFYGLAALALLSDG